jgi:hypothetical protein
MLRPDGTPRLPGGGRPVQKTFVPNQPSAERPVVARCPSE